MNQRVLKSIRELLAQTLPPNASARLYGSQARGDAHLQPGSVAVVKIGEKSVKVVVK